MKVDWLREPACSSKRSNRGGGAKKKEEEGEWGRGKGELSLSFPLIRFLFHSPLLNSRCFSSLAWTALNFTRVNKMGEMYKRSPVTFHLWSLFYLRA